ncbi:MAG: tyrosine decarboxylase MfnA [Methanomicrobium sp.]|nr:tyrosine decarboxylase MfnA [Methanomicrobium sp.]
MNQKGRSEEELFSFLAEMRGKDRKYHKVISSMCTIPHPVAVRAYDMFVESNLGDPGLFSGTAEIEALLVKSMGELLGCGNVGGYSTSGGTESNIQALRIARNLAKGRTKFPNVVIPESAHFSFDKACDILSLEMRVVPSDKDYRMDEEKIPDYVDKNTICLVGVAGTTEYGVVDPISYLSDISEDKDIFLHVDAAFGGLVLPYIRNAPEFDFRLPGFDTISADPHKMGIAIIPAGCLMARYPSMFKTTEVDTPYLTVNKECTLCGTRPGASVVSAYAVQEYLGSEGMQKVVDTCMKNSRRLIKGMAEMGIPVAAQPDVNVASFVCPDTPEGWKVSRTRKGHMRTVCMPHVTEEVADGFLADVKTLLEKKNH